MFPHRNLQWWQRTTTALTTPSSQEAQSTFRTWSDHRRAAGQRSAAVIALTGTSSLSTVYINKRTLRCLTSSNGCLVFSQDFKSLFGHVVNIVFWGGGGGGHESTDDAPWGEEMRILSSEDYHVFISWVQFVPKSSPRAFSCQRDMWEALCSCVSCGFWQLRCLFHGATLPLMHTQCAVYAPVALQTPHAVHSSTGRLSALFVAILISYVLLDLFFYGCSK